MRPNVLSQCHHVVPSLRGRVDGVRFHAVDATRSVHTAPWRGESGESAARHGIRGERPNLPRSWDQKVVDLIRNCWAHEPAARPSFLAILDLLDELASAGLVEQDTAVVPSAKACCVVS